MYKVISFKEKDRWDNTLELFSKKDVYYLHGYCYLYYLIGDGEPFLFFYENESGGKICYPFIKRPLILPFNCVGLEGEYFDMITPYGYGGPLLEQIDEQAICEFRKEFDRFCAHNHIISEFIRFHPLLNNHQYFDPFLDDVVYDRKTVYINLIDDEDEILRKFHKNHLRNLNKAKKNKLEFKVFVKDDALQITNEFYQLYKKTMDKLNASDYYYFSFDYIKSFFEQLNNHSIIAAVFLEDRMISAALCMHVDGFLHYHLGCSEQEYLHHGSNTFLFYNLAFWGKCMGLRFFHLGGGHVGRDSLFQFKYRFNNEGELPFYIGKKIHNRQKYNVLVESWGKYYDQKPSGLFFPSYRQKPLKQIIPDY